ncbi:MAG: cation:proton antiporter [Fibromonadales bacterium]|nr:cation:proton antiporter [Fibromonadales bacterium]
MEHNYDLIILLALGFTIALGFGYITQRLRLSPILGYLLAGVLVSPHTFLAPQLSKIGVNIDKGLATQLSEVGVILLLFGVGLHFTLKDLLAVKRVSLPGAIVQSATATLLATLFLHWAGYSWLAGLIIGMSISVASTVVLVRVLSDNNVLNTSQGHIAIGWLVVEDIFSVLILVLLPALREISHGEGTSVFDILASLGIAMGKMGLVAIVILAGGKKIIPWILTQIARTRSRELFTLAVLAIVLLIATGAYYFGASFALGAFFAGMVVGQSKLSEQAAADAMPMKDAFSVLFFVAVGMLFDPNALLQNTHLFILLMGIILIAKPLAALFVVIGLGYSTITAFTVAIALSQIGEFSFILAGEANKLDNVNLLSDEKYSTLIAAAIVSLALNPLWFRFVPVLEKLLSRYPKLWLLLNRRAAQRASKLEPAKHIDTAGKRVAVVVGYGPVGKTVTRIFQQSGIHPVIIDMNVDTITLLNESGMEAVFGDASKEDILKAAGIEKASYLIITPPDLGSRIPIVSAARNLNENVKVYSRARYITEREMLETLGVSQVCYEEAEAAVGIAEMVLREEGADNNRIIEEIANIREKFAAIDGSLA